MLAVKSRGLNEKRLFHGTSPETVEAICKQNFDWRLHGKNATVYGEGSYFALNASYSDAYAKEDANSCRFMFVAKVLVGSYAMGHSSYRRPPQKDPSNPASDLYDSCVNDKSNPTIFVVFDTDQFYPEYIIKYSHENAWYSVDTHGSRTAALPRSSSTPGTSVYSSTHGVSAGHSTGLNAAGVSSYSNTSRFNSGSVSGYNTSSASYAASTGHQTAATRSHSGASNSYNSSSASSTAVTSTPYQSASRGVSSYRYTSGFNSGSVGGYNTSSASNAASSTRYQSAATRAHSGASNMNYYPSSSPSTSSTPYQSATRGASGGYYTSSPSSNSSTRYQDTTSRSNPRCSVM